MFKVKRVKYPLICLLPECLRLLTIRCKGKNIRISIGLHSRIAQSFSNTVSICLHASFRVFLFYLFYGVTYRLPLLDYTRVITRTRSSYQKTVAFSGGLLRKNSNAAGQSHMHSQHVQAKLACTGQQSRSMIQIENELRCKHIHGINETILLEAEGSVREFSREVCIPKKTHLSHIDWRGSF